MPNLKSLKKFAGRHLHRKKSDQASVTEESEPKIEVIKYMLDWATEPSDCHPFPVVAPPKKRPDSERAPIHSPSQLCKVCQRSLEYFAYVVGEYASRESDDQRPAHQQAVRHHQSIHDMSRSAAAGCHLCNWLVMYVKVRSDIPDPLSNTQIELSWDSTELFDKEDRKISKRGRLYFAETHPHLKREINKNYLTFLRLQPWPAKYTHLFWSPFQKTSKEVAEEDSLSVSSDGGVSEIHESCDGLDAITEGLGSSQMALESDHEARTQDDEHKDVTTKLDRPGSASESEIVSSRSAGSDDSERPGDPAGFISTSPRQLVNHWLTKCQKDVDGKHIECNADQRDWLPTRLLDVERARKTSIVYLVTPTKNPAGFARKRKYATLSHCWGQWGPTGIPVLTTTNEVDRHKTGISFELLPKTFQDAIEVAGWFKIPWLWIDSLCIMQDSHSDWSSEASRMHDVYKKGFLNISADAAKDARDGLLYFSPRINVPLVLKLPMIQESILLTIDERNTFDWVNEAPLSQRAWVFQERHLARRILHFTKHEMVWECCAKAPCFASNFFPNGAPLARIFDEKPKLQTRLDDCQSIESVKQIYDEWDDICQMYSEKSHTKKEDKLIALSGLATEFEQLLPNDSYVEGLWRSTLPQSLLWDTAGGFQIERSSGTAPSWSWASTDAPIMSRPRKYRKGREGVPVCKIMDVVTPVPPQDSSHERSSLSALHILGFIRRITIQDNHVQNNPVLATFGHKQSLAVHSGQRSAEFPTDVLDEISWSLDNGAKPNVLDAFLLLVTADSHDVEGLLLREKPGEVDTFERIGTMTCDSRYRNLEYGGIRGIAIRYHIKNEVEIEKNMWGPFKDSVGQERDKTEQPSDKGDIFENLYNHVGDMDESHFERLTPRNIRLV